MNAAHTTQHDESRRLDWLSEVKLAIVLSIATVIVTVGLAGRVSDRALVLGAIVAASAIAWSRVEPLDEALADIPHG